MLPTPVTDPTALIISGKRLETGSAPLSFLLCSRQVGRAEGNRYQSIRVTDALIIGDKPQAGAQISRTLGPYTCVLPCWGFIYVGHGIKFLGSVHLFLSPGGRQGVHAQSARVITRYTHINMPSEATIAQVINLGNDL